MDKEELYKQYYIEFGEFPPVMMTTNGDSEEYLKLISEAIKSKKKIDNEQIDEIFKNNYDLVSEDNKQFKTFKKGNK